MGRLLSQALQEIGELALGRLLQFVELGFFARRVRRASRIAVGHHQVVMRRLIRRAEASQRVPAARWLRHTVLPPCVSFASASSASGKSGLRAAARSKRWAASAGFCPASRIWPTWYSATASEGFSANSASNSVARQRQILRRVRFQQQRAAQAEVQIQRRRIFLDGFAVFGGRFRVTSLHLENLRRKLVHAERGGGLLKHLEERIVPGLHVEARGFIEHVGIGRIQCFQARQDRECVVIMSGRETALGQGESGEAAQLGVASLFELRGQIGLRGIAAAQAAARVSARKHTLLRTIRRFFEQR